MARNEDQPARAFIDARDFIRDKAILASRRRPMHVLAAHLFSVRRTLDGG